MGLPFKHVRWGKLPRPTVKNTRYYGDKAAQMVALQSFSKKMTKTAKRAAESAAHIDNNASERFDAAFDAVRNARSKMDIGSASYLTGDPSQGVGYTLKDYAYMAESVSDKISPEDYKFLTNPMRTARAVDVLKKRYKNESFLRMIKQFSKMNRIQNPDDVIAIGRLSLEPSSIQDTALEWMKKDFNTSNMSLRDVVSSAKIL
jgi:hypothetical protein